MNMKDGIASALFLPCAILYASIACAQLNIMFPPNLKLKAVNTSEGAGFEIPPDVARQIPVEADKPIENTGKLKGNLAELTHVVYDEQTAALGILRGLVKVQSWQDVRAINPPGGDLTKWSDHIPGTELHIGFAGNSVEAVGFVKITNGGLCFGNGSKYHINLVERTAKGEYEYQGLSVDILGHRIALGSIEVTAEGVKSFGKEYLEVTEYIRGGKKSDVLRGTVTNVAGRQIEYVPPLGKEAGNLDNMLNTIELVSNAAKTTQTDFKSRTQEKRLGQIPGKTMHVICASTPMGCHATHVVKLQNGSFVVLRDGEPGHEYDGIGPTLAYPLRDPTSNAWTIMYYSYWDERRNNGVLGRESSLQSVDPVSCPSLISADGNMLGYAARRGSKWVVVMDRKVGPEYDAIAVGSPVFSPDSKRIAYAAKKRDKWVVVADGQPGPAYSSIDRASLTFSSDGKRLAYIAKDGDKSVVVVDGRPVGRHDTVRLFQFSPDGKRFAYVSEVDGKAVVLIDGQVSGEFDVVWLMFSPDANRIVYRAARGDKQFIVLNGEHGAEYDLILPANIVFSSDGKRLAYIAKDGDKSVVLLDGRPVGEWEYAFGLTFSPDGKRVAYVAERAGKRFVVLDGQPGPDFDQIDYRNLVFSSDGRRLAYPASQGDKEVVVVDGQVGPQFDRIEDAKLVFSPDNRHVAYVAGTGKKRIIVAGQTVLGEDGQEVVVLDGQPGPQFDSIRGAPSFSSDGKRLAYLAAKDQKWLVVLDGQTGPEYEDIGRQPINSVLDAGRVRGIIGDGTGKTYLQGPGGRLLIDNPHVPYVMFSPDAKRVAYLASRASKWFIVVDGEAGPEYDEIPVGPIFTEDGVLEYLAQKGNDLYRVTCLCPYGL